MSETKKVIISTNPKRNMQEVVYKGDGTSVTKHEPIDPTRPSRPPVRNTKENRRR